MNSITLTDTLVIDLDDTLYLERDFVSSGFKAVGQHVDTTFGISDFGETCWRLFSNGVRGNTFDLAAAGHNWKMTHDDKSDLISIYRNHIPSIALDQPTRDTLQALSAQHRLLLFTGGFAPTQRRKVYALRLETYFDDIVFTGALGKDFDKPSLHYWRHIEEISGCSGKNLTCIGDNPVKDIGPSLSAGWQAIRVRRFGSLHANAPTPAGAREIRRFSELLKVCEFGRSR